MRRMMLIFLVLLCLMLAGAGYMAQQAQVIAEEQARLQQEILTLEQENALLRERVEELKKQQAELGDRMESWLDTWEVEIWESTAYAPLDSLAVVGGFEIACEWAGMEIVGQVEIEPFCQKVLAKHWPHVKRMGDIKQVRGDEFGAVDIIIGGVPCQPASVAGKRRGTEDDRWLWPEALRIVRTVRPRWCVFENPPGILSLQGGVPFDDILSEMEREGYEVGAYSIPACSVGAPHKRERIFIVAFSASVQCRAGSEVERVLRTVPENGQEYDYPDRPGKTRDAYVADTQNPDRRRADGEENSGRGDTEAGGCNIEGDRQKHGAVESRLGGVLNGFSAGMDGTKWPAGWWQTPSVEDAGRTGSEEAWMEYEKDGRTTQCRLRNQIWAHWPAGPGEQYPWEPPRIAATGVKDRVARLKALGNAVVPAQVYPILKAISEIERMLSE